MADWLIATIGVIIGYLGTATILIGVFTSWINIKYRRDTNRDLRKNSITDLNILYNNFSKNIDNPEYIESENIKFKILGHLYSPLSKKNNFKRSKKNNMFLNKKIILSQFKNYEDISGDFMLNSKTSFKRFLKKAGFNKVQSIEDFTDDDLKKIILLLSILLFTFNFDLIHYEQKYKKVMKLLSSSIGVTSEKMKSITSLGFLKEVEKEQKEMQEVQTILEEEKKVAEVEEKISEDILSEDPKDDLEEVKKTEEKEKNK